MHLAYLSGPSMKQLATLYDKLRRCKVAVVKELILLWLLIFFYLNLYYHVYRKSIVDSHTRDILKKLFTYLISDTSCTVLYITQFIKVTLNKTVHLHSKRWIYR